MMQKRPLPNGLEWMKSTWQNKWFFSIWRVTSFEEVARYHTIHKYSWKGDKLNRLPATRRIHGSWWKQANHKTETGVGLAHNPNKPPINIGHRRCSPSFQAEPGNYYITPSYEAWLSVADFLHFKHVRTRVTKKRVSGYLPRISLTLLKSFSKVVREPSTFISGSSSSSSVTKESLSLVPKKGLDSSLTCVSVGKPA